MITQFHQFKLNNDKLLMDHDPECEIRCHEGRICLMDVVTKIVGQGRGRSSEIINDVIKKSHLQDYFKVKMSFKTTGGLIRQKK